MNKHTLQKLCKLEIRINEHQKYKKVGLLIDYSAIEPISGNFFSLPSERFQLDHSLKEGNSMEWSYWFQPLCWQMIPLGAHCTLPWSLNVSFYDCGHWISAKKEKVFLFAPCRCLINSVKSLGQVYLKIKMIKWS